MNPLEYSSQRIKLTGIKTGKLLKMERKKK